MSLMKNPKMTMEEESESSKKVVCIWVLDDDKQHQDWFAIDPRLPPGCNNNIKLKDMATPLNCLHNHLIGSGSAILGSKLFLIGGMCRDDPNPLSNIVSIYDTIDHTWTQGSPMIENRYPLAVFVIDHKIYVFGTTRFSFHLKFISIDKWVECYDSISGQWRTIPGPDYFNLRELNDMADLAVVHHGDQIRFLSHHPHFFVFNLSSETWLPLSAFPGPEFPIYNFPSNHVYYGDFALWHLYGHVFAWDLTTNRTSFLFKLEDKANWWPTDDECPHDANTDIFHLGDGFMCIVFWTWTRRDGSRVACYTFQILGSPVSTKADDLDIASMFKLGQSDVHYYDVPGGYSITQAVALCAKDVGFETTKENCNTSYDEATKASCL